MSRLILLIVFLAALIGGVYFLSTLPKQQPTAVIETEVAVPGNAQ